MGNLTSPRKQLRVPNNEAVPSLGAARISVVWRLPQVMREFGVDLGELLEAAGAPNDIFDDRETRIP
jgi:hypothetical protein